MHRPGANVAWCGQPSRHASGNVAHAASFLACRVLIWPLCTMFKSASIVPPFTLHTVSSGRGGGGKLSNLGHAARARHSSHNQCRLPSRDNTCKYSSKMATIFSSSNRPRAL